MSGTAESAPLVLAARTGGASQQWKFAEALDGGDRLTNVHSGLTADVSGGQATENAPIVQYRATGADNQHWRAESTDGGHVRLVCVRTGKSLGPAAWLHGDGHRGRPADVHGRGVAAVEAGGRVGRPGGGGIFTASPAPGPVAP